MNGRTSDLECRPHVETNLAGVSWLALACKKGGTPQIEVQPLRFPPFYPPGFEHC